MLQATSLSEVILPDSITTIWNHAFEGCSNLQSITLPDGVKKIYSNAFASTGLTSITIPSSVTSIVAQAFSSCSSLQTINVESGNTAYKSNNGVLFNKDGKTIVCYPAGKGSYTIPDGVTTIGEYAFEGCSNLTSITIPSSVTYIGDRAFSSCSSLQSISVDSGNTAYKSDDGVLFNKDGNTIVCYPAGKNGESYTIPDGVTTIGKYAFEGYSNLETIVLEKVQNINNYAFYGSGLTSITIPSAVETIGKYAFYNCPSLFQITIQKTKDAITGEPWGGNKVISGDMVVNKKHTVSVTWTGDTGNQ